MRIKICLSVIFVFAISICFCQNLRFEQNIGQWDEHVLFQAKAQNTTIFITKDGITFLVNSDKHNHDHEQTNSDKEIEKTLVQYHAFKLTIKGKEQNSQIIPQNEMQGYSNYFIGNDKTKWKSGVKSYSDIIFKDVYKGIDWRIYSNDGNFKHDFILHPGANVEDILLEYENVSNLWLQDNNLVLSTACGDIVEHKPLAYQKIKGEKIDLEAKFILNNNKVSYQINNYDKDVDLILDPVLVFSTYSGSTADNWGFTATYDDKGYLYAGGISEGYTGYPTTYGAFQTVNNGNWDATITKFSANGTNLIYSTYIGGSKADLPSSLYVNSFGELLILGVTGSNDFPTINAYQSLFAGGSSVSYMNFNLSQGTDIFVCKLSANGTQLLSSTYVGGTSNDGLNYRNNYYVYGNPNTLYYNYGDGIRGELITDDKNNVYVGSCTFSLDFPTANAFQPTSKGNLEGVVFKLDNNLQSMLFSSYLGGIGDDAIYSVDVDSTYRLYVTGGTMSYDFPVTQSAFQKQHKGGYVDCFLSLISYDGSQLLASTYYGSEFYDQSYFIRTDKNNYPHIFGQTKANGSQMIYGNVLQEPGGGQVIAKFSPLLDSLIWSGVFSGTNRDVNISPTAFGVDKCGRIYISGWGRHFKYNVGTSSTFGTYGMSVTSDAYSINTDGQDFYIASFNTDPLTLNYGTFLGENNNSLYIGNDHVDGGTSRFDKFGNLYQAACASCGGSQSFPVLPANAWSNNNGSSNCNLAAIKFSVHNDYAVANFDLTPVQCMNYYVQFTNNSRGDNFQWFFGDGTVSTDRDPSHTYSQPGIYEVTLVAQKNNACLEFDTAKHTVVILGNSKDTLPTLYTCPNIPIQIGLMLNTPEDITCHWIPTTGLTNPNISDPYATIYGDTTYYLIISSNGCSDTLVQMIKLTDIATNAPDTIHICSYPQEIIIPELDNYSTIASWDREFSDTIGVIQDISQSTTINISTFESRYLYFMQWAGACEGRDSTWIDYQGISIDLQVTANTCPNSSDGEASLTISNIKDTVICNFFNPISQTDTSIIILNDTLFKITNYEIGNYTISFEISDSCNTILNFTITEDSVFNVEHSYQNNPCAMAKAGQINLHITGGKTPYNISWSNGETTDTIKNLPIGDYIYIVSDAKGCIISDTVHIIVDDSIILSINHTDNNCIEGCSAEATVEISGGLTPYHYLWNNGNDTPVANNLCVGNYTVTVTDSAGCVATQNVNIGYNYIYTGVNATASDYLVYDGQTIILLSQPQIDGVTYQWTPTTGLSSPNHNITFATMYATTTFYILISDGHDCLLLDSVTINVDRVVCDKPNIHIPNVFTPNDDGKNDILYVTGEYIRKIKFMIFDRWGEKVFETTNINEGWDGRFRGQMCQNGVYFYRLEVECEAERTYSTSGDITLIR
ncbi:MAG: gliding motility-associated C-terminal domain-containing protein [Bacteroidales bacterium]|jgi:gliding motility-associated-like protein|nr:gliding motility-associated C-terminal domain-containing protein [Bacteroidales bacterium]